MMYQLQPLNGNVAIVSLKSKEVKEYTSKVLADVETNKIDVLNYGRVVEVGPYTFEQATQLVALTYGSEVPPHLPDLKPGDIVLYQKLAAHSTNFGDPRIVLVPIENIEGKLTPVEEAKKEAPND